MRYLVSRSADNGRKNSSWSIVASKTGFAHAGSIVDYKCSNVVIAHDGNNSGRTAVKNTEVSFVPKRLEVAGVSPWLSQRRENVADDCNRRIMKRIVSFAHLG